MSDNSEESDSESCKEPVCKENFPNEHFNLYFPPRENVPQMSQEEFCQKMLANSKVLVVGLFGKSSYLDHLCGKKSNIFDHLMQRDIFKIAQDEEDNKSLASSVIFGHYDEDSGRIYLQLFSTHDDAFHQVKEGDDFFRHFASKKEQDNRLLLFLFHVCHLLICFHPSHALDHAYIGLFQGLDHALTKAKKYVQLRGQKLPKEWINQSRVTAPRLIFYFATCPLELRGSKGTKDLVKRDGKVAKHPPIRKLEFSIEDQIYRVFRKAKILVSGCSGLFTIPSREGFVYVENGTDTSYGDSSMDQLNNLFSAINTPIDSEDGNNVSQQFLPYFYQQTVTESRSVEAGRSFSRFLSGHLEAVRSKGPEGINDKSFELPTALQWIKGASLTFDQLSKAYEDYANANSLAHHLQNISQIDLRFSEARCAKALPQAVAAYKDGLQSHYLEEYHNAKLLQAMAMFSVQARGPASGKYAEMLAEECTSYWQSGRQMCETLSLTGNHCTNRKHQISSESQTEADEEVGAKKKRILPTMPHQSGVVYLSACNCGRKQSNKDDPFTLVEANHTFYAEMEADCCGDLEHITVPIHEQKIEESQQLLLNADNTDKLQSLANLVTSPHGLKPSTSTIECIPYMPTKLTGPDKLPAFPSWSLTQIGSSFLYSHSSGVNQPGFLTGTKTLHPWDAPLKKTDWATLEAKWPNLADIAAKKSNFNPQKKIADIGITVKAFIGMEYECPRGHRFISATPNKAVKGSKDTPSSAMGAKFFNSDIPLYLGCPCRGSSASRPIVAQLMRVHIVTPKGPLNITVRPSVIPCPDGPEFHPGWTEPIKLPITSYWVLRLPRVYCGEQGAHLPPKEAPDSSYGRLLQGFVGVVEDCC